MSQKIQTLISQHNLPKNGKDIWKDAYNEEYDGLKKLSCYHIITEAEYQLIKNKCKFILPSMAIYTIKYVDNIPIQANYRIGALRNLDPVN